MMQLEFCSHCGARLTLTAPFAPQHCAHCTTWHFQNSKPCAGALVLENKKVLLAQRGVAPFKGFWDIPGGFLEAGEHPEHGAIRELLEETGLEIRLNGLLGMYMDTYGDEKFFTLNIYYVAEVVRGTPRATDDVAKLEWFALDAVPKEFAFAHEYQVMEDLRRWVTASG